MSPSTLRSSRREVFDAQRNLGRLSQPRQAKCIQERAARTPGSKHDGPHSGSAARQWGLVPKLCNVTFLVPQCADKPLPHRTPTTNRTKPGVDEHLFELTCFQAPTTLGFHDGQSVGGSGGRGCVVPLMNCMRIPPLFPSAPPIGRCVEGPCVSRKRTEPWSYDKLPP